MIQTRILFFLILILITFGVDLSAQIRITEIMHDPATVDGKVLAEYIEIYNDSTEKILITDFFIKDGTNKPIATIKKQQAYIMPKSYYVITHDTSIYKKFPDLKDSLNIAFTGSTFLGLNLDSDKVVIFDKQGLLQDSIQYFNDWHRKDILTTKGISLEKISPNSNGNLANSWTSCVAALGGTPCRRNSVTSDGTISEKIFTASPLTFSPDRDGTDEILNLKYNLPNGNFRATIKVYDKHGREIRTIANNLNVAGYGEQIWDGNTDSGSLANMGVYVVRFEYYSDINSLKVEQVTVVLAKKF